MTLPPEVLTQLGGPGKFEMEVDDKEQILNLTRSDRGELEDYGERGSSCSQAYAQPASTSMMIIRKSAHPVAHQGPW